MIQFVNGWKNLSKNWSRIDYKLVLSVVTLYEVYVDFLDQEYRFTLLNFSLTNMD